MCLSVEGLRARRYQSFTSGHHVDLLLCLLPVRGGLISAAAVTVQVVTARRSRHSAARRRLRSGAAPVSRPPHPGPQRLRLRLTATGATRSAGPAAAPPRPYSRRVRPKASRATGETRGATDALPLGRTRHMHAPTPVSLALAGSPMQANAEPTDAPEAEVPTRIDNQHNKLDRTMPVRSHRGRNAQSPMAAPCIKNRSRPKTRSHAWPATSLGPTTTTALLA